MPPTPPPGWEPVGQDSASAAPAGWTPVEGWESTATRPPVKAEQSVQPSDVRFSDTGPLMGTRSFWLGDPARPGLPSVFGGLKNDLSSLWDLAKQTAITTVLPSTDPLRVKMMLDSDPVGGITAAVKDPLATSYQMGPFNTAGMIAGGIEAGADLARGVSSMATRGGTMRSLQRLPQAPGSVFGAGTDMVDAAATAPEAARVRGVQSYNRIKDSKLGSVFVPDAPETPAQAQLRLKREQLAREPRPKTPSADEFAEVRARQSKAAAARGLPAPPDISLSSVTPDQLRALSVANPSSDIAELSAEGDQTVGDIRQAAKPGFPTRTGASTMQTPVSRAGTPPTYQQELSRVAQLPDAPAAPTPGAPLREVLDEKSNLGRRETGLPGPKPSTSQLAQLHRAAEQRLIQAVRNAGEDPAPLIQAREQYARARQIGRVTQPVRGKAAGSVVDMFSDPKQLATAAQKVRVYDVGKAPRVMNVKEWYGALQEAAPKELDAVMRHAEAKLIDSAVDVRAKTIDGPKLQAALKAYEDQGIQLPHHEQVKKLAQLATDKKWDEAPRLLKGLQATVLREAAKGAGLGAAGYALYHWWRLKD